MAIKLCRECGNQVSTEAATCPKCGVADPGRELAPGETVSAQAKAKAMQTIGCTIFIVAGLGFALLLLLVLLFTVL